MNPVQKVIPGCGGAALDPGRDAEAERLYADRETIKGSQALVGQMGPGMGNISPTPDVLHPERED